MKLPQWVKGLIASAILASIAWGFNVGERLSAVEIYIKESIKRLDRIERKVDEIREQGK